MDSQEAAEQATKRQKVDTTGMIEHRFLVTNEESSVIIGRKGSNVMRVREASGCFVSIRAANPATNERIMTIKGLPEAISSAVNVIASILQQNAKTLTGALDTSVTMKLLVHKFLVGCILGQAGAIMKDIQNSTTARISISEPMPNSTDKAVSLIGTPEAIYAATARVIEQLQGNPLRPGSITKEYVPGAMLGAPSFQPWGMGRGGPQPGYDEFTGFGVARGVPGAAGLKRASVPGGPQEPAKTEKIVIPKSCSGAVIGRGGSIVTELKLQTGAAISLSPSDPASDDRVVSITGGQGAIQLAIRLIHQKVEAELARQSSPGYVSAQA